MASSDESKPVPAAGQPVKNQGPRPENKPPRHPPNQPNWKHGSHFGKGHNSPPRAPSRVQGRGR